MKKISSNRFDKDVKENKLYVKDLKNYAREMYIYKMRNAMEFKSYYTNNYFKVHKEVIYDYLQDKKSTVEKLFENYILDDINLYDIKVSVKNQIGYTLLENEFKENVIINEFEHNPKNEVKKIHDIIDSIKNIYAKELVLTVTKNNQTISFRFPKRELYSQSIWNMYIKNTSERKLVEELYDNRDFSMKDIIKIEYRKKLLYKDNNKKRKIYNKCVDSNTHKQYNKSVEERRAKMTEYKIGDIVIVDNKFDCKIKDIVQGDFEVEYKNYLPTRFIEKNKMKLNKVQFIVKEPDKKPKVVHAKELKKDIFLLALDCKTIETVTIKEFEKRNIIMLKDKDANEVDKQWNFDIYNGGVDITNVIGSVAFVGRDEKNKWVTLTQEQMDFIKNEFQGEY